jgi:hypothetical protein
MEKRPATESGTATTPTTTPATTTPTTTPATTPTTPPPITPAAQRRAIIGEEREVPIARVGAGRRIGLMFIGLLTTAIGAWAAVVVFAGPSFGYALDGEAAWHWSGHRLLLNFAPGVAAAVAGLLIISAAARWRRAAGSRTVVLSGLLAIVAGGWLVVGQEVWSVLRTPNPIYYDAPSQWIHFTRVIGMQLGPGLLLAALGGLAAGLGMLSARRMLLVERTAQPSAELPGTPAPRPVRTEGPAAR